MGERWSVTSAWNFYLDGDFGCSRRYHTPGPLLSPVCLS